MSEDRPDIFYFFGTYPNDDARRLLDAFVSGGIEYTLHTDRMGIRNMSPGQAATGGTFGSGAGIAIGVHIYDVEEAMAIRLRVLKIIT